MLGDSDSANDIAQDSFVSAYEGLDRFRGTAKFSTWLAAIVLNKCRDRLRTQKNSVPLDEISEVIRSPAPDPERIAAARETGEAIQKALSRLSPDDRAAIILKHLAGLEYEEISAIMGASVAALKVRTHRARERLREALEQQGVRP